MNEQKNDFPMRLQAFLSRSGYCARRKAEEIIRSGRVSVNGSQVKDPAFRVESDDAVACDGVFLELMEHVYYVLNKPRGYVCSNADPHADLFARDLVNVPEMRSLFSVGRLDKESTGLIIFTNDGFFANTVAHPSHGIEKEYLIRTRERLERGHLTAALKGCLIDGELYRIERYTLMAGRQASLILKEGKNREIRRIMEHFGYRVLSLQRTRIGCVELGSLPSGRFRPLKRKEREALLKGGL